MNTKIVLGTQIVVMLMENIQKNNQYILANKIILLRRYFDLHILSSIPKVHNNIKIHLQDELYYLSKNMFYATYNKGNIRMKYLTELLVNISLIDMFLVELRDIKTIKLKKINNAISILQVIKNIVYGWKVNEEKKRI